MKNQYQNKLNTIAETANCSVSTVSRVLSGYNKRFSVRQELREKILQCAQELNYRPNPYLRSMHTCNTRLIAVFEALGQVRDEVVLRAKQALISDLQAQGYLETGRYGNVNKNFVFSLNFPVDGAVFFDIVSPANLAFVEEEQIPYVVINGISSKNGQSILVDEAYDAELLLRHLLEAGHRRIAYYAGQFEWEHYSLRERKQTLQVNFTEHGLPPILETGKNCKSAEDYLRTWVLPQNITAVICYNHVKAISLMHAAWETGIRIPEQLSIVCFDDEYPLAELNPPVTCVSTPGEEMGHIAARMLLEQIRQPKLHVVSSTRVRGELVARSSVKKIN